MALASAVSMNNFSALHLRQAEIQLCERCSAMPFHYLYQLCSQIQFKILIIIKWHGTSFVGFSFPFKEKPLLCASFQLDQSFHLQFCADAETELSTSAGIHCILVWPDVKMNVSMGWGSNTHGGWLEWGTAHRKELGEMWTDQCCLQLLQNNSQYHYQVAAV